MTNSRTERGAVSAGAFSRNGSHNNRSHGSDVWERTSMYMFRNVSYADLIF